MSRIFEIESDDKIGANLRSVIRGKYESVRKFCKAFLILKDGETNDEEIRKLLNRFSQILKGKKRIQIDDLPFLAELLDMSCEEILTAGELHIPVGRHITNYDIAFSHDRDEWDRYMKREDKLFLNCDEYCKTVIDYALDFKNYEFMKYLIDEGFIWLTDPDAECLGFSYGAGTSVKRRDLGSIDTGVPLELMCKDELRTRCVALAIENEDSDMLDRLLAREVPEMRMARISGYPDVDLSVHRNDELIKAVALANDVIVDYFSREFTVRCAGERDNTFIFPYIGEVIKIMVENGGKNAKLPIRRATEHNKKTLAKLNELYNELYKELYDKIIKNHGLYMQGSDEYVKESINEMALYDFRFDSKNNIVSYFRSLEKHVYDGIVTNVVRVDTKSEDPEIRSLLDELNSVFDEIANMKKTV